MKILTVGALGVAAGVLADAPHLIEQQDINQNHFKQGDIPSETITQVVGHNNDSQSHPTILNFRVSGTELIFEETPAGDESKVRVTRLNSLTQLGYTGHIADLGLSILVAPVSNNRFSVELSAKWYESSFFLFVQTVTKSSFLVDLGHGYFEVPPSK
jgi:hypothetical protein